MHDQSHTYSTRVKGGICPVVHGVLLMLAPAAWRDVCCEACPLLLTCTEWLS